MAKSKPGPPKGVRYGGKPKGYKAAHTLERDAVSAAFKQRVLKSADRLFNAQLSVAEGCSFLFRVDRPKGKAGKEKHVLVTDQDEITRYLDQEVDPDTHYYISTREPNNQAIADMLNRAMGRPVESIEVTGKDGGPVAYTWQDAE